MSDLFDTPNEMFEDETEKLGESLAKRQGERLKEILSANRMMQKEAARRLSYQPNHISMICSGRRRLTPDVARKVCSWFPGWRAEYLLCDDDYKTVDEFYEAMRAERALDEAWNDAESVDVFLEKLGFTFTFDTDSTCYVSERGVPIGACTSDEYENMEREIREFAEFKIKNLVKDRSANNG